MVLDNLRKTQLDVAKELERNISNNLLPSSILFSGPVGSSRLTGALDLAFYLTGEDRALLSSPNIIYFPHRELYSRVNAALNLFINEKSDYSRYFLIETLRVVSMQYNKALVDSAPSSISSLFKVASQCDEYLNDIESRKDEGYTKKESKEVIDFFKNKILDPKYLYFGKKVPTSISIDSIRAIEEWMSSGNEERVIIIEDIEDATEGAKNSLLKTLEEPLNNCHFILISKKSQKIMETILSRVRKFVFPPLSSNVVSSLIKNRFNEWNSYNSFSEFFFKKGYGEEILSRVEKEVNSFVSILLEKNSTIEKEESILSLIDELACFNYFITQALTVIEKKVKNGEIKAKKGKEIIYIINEKTQFMEIYNMGQREAIDLMIRECEYVK